MATSTYALVGYGSHGHDIEMIWRRRYPVWKLDVFDEDRKRGKAPRGGERCFVGVNWPVQRRDLVRRLGLRGAPALIDPQAIVGDGCVFGDGVVIAPSAVLLRDVRLGEHVHVNFMASMTRCVIGDFTTVGPAATICGDVIIGKAVLIGCGSVIKDRVSVGDGATIGAGAVVVSDVEAGATMVGVPARPVTVGAAM